MNFQTFKVYKLLPAALLASVWATQSMAVADAADDALWKQLDGNESGWLSGRELDAGAGGWVKFDTDGDKEVTRAEFDAGRAATRPPTDEADLQKADRALFLKLDSTETGAYLSGNDLDYPRVRSYDANGDERVTWAEFAAGRARDRKNAGVPGAPPADNAEPQVEAEVQGEADAPNPQPAPVQDKPLEPMAIRPDYIVGRAVFSDGRPLPSFQIEASGYIGQAAFGAGVPSLGTMEGTNGRYELHPVDKLNDSQPVDALILDIKGTAHLSYRGQKYEVPLHPMDGRPSFGDIDKTLPWSTPGLTRDFVLKIAGLKPGRVATTDYNQPVYYGGTLIVDRAWGLTVPKTGKFVFSLVPEGPLLDGSTGQNLTREIASADFGHIGSFFPDIPLGAYQVSGRWVGDDGTSRPLQLQHFAASDTFGPTKTLVWSPESMPSAHTAKMLVQF